MLQDAESETSSGKSIDPLSYYLVCLSCFFCHCSDAAATSSGLSISFFIGNNALVLLQSNL